MKRKKRLTRAKKIALGRLDLIKKKAEIAAEIRKKKAHKLNKELNPEQLAGSLKKYANGYVPLEKIREMGIDSTTLCGEDQKNLEKWEASGTDRP